VNPAAETAGTGLLSGSDQAANVGVTRLQLFGDELEVGAEADDRRAKVALGVQHGLRVGDEL